jgi:hypothetical protein
MAHIRLPQRHSKLRFLLLAIPALLVVFTLARLGFVLYFEGLRGLAEPGMGRTLYLGLKFDLRLSVLLLLPVWLLWRPGAPVRRALPGALILALALGLYVTLVLIAMVDDRAARPWLLAFLGAAALLRWGFPDTGLLGSRLVRWIWGGYAAFAVGLTYLAYFVDIGAFAYIHTRLNGTLTMFLENAATSLKVVWQTYPIVWLVLGFGLLVAATVWGLARLLGPGSPPSLPRARSRAVHFGVSLLLLLAMWGKASRYPLRWGEVFEGRTAFQAQATLNPVLFFLETRRDMDGGYDLAKVRQAHPLLASYFGIPLATDGAGLPTLQRTIPPRPLATGRPNLVFIQLESFAGFKTGVLGNPANPTPFFDNLCQNGIFFDRTYVVMENTSRSMFATLFGIPDVSSTENATRNPLLVDQASVLHALKGYDRSFYLGGSANWAQIRGILKNNFPDLTIFEEGSWKSPVVDVWGVCDLDLLLETNGHLAKKTGPFWAYVQTSGNHPPFTIPSHVKDFREVKLDPEVLRRSGFTGNEEFNSLRFMDHSLARYFEAARREAYFANTIFVLWADHGIPRGSTDPRFGDLSLAIHHIPFLIYAPGLIREGRRVHTVTTQMDMLPTVLSLMGVPAETRTLGKDALDPAWAEGAAAFTFTTFRRPPRIGLVQGDWYVNLEPDGRPALYRLDEPSPADRATGEPARTREMRDLAQAFHTWSRYLLSHNKAGSPGKTIEPVRNGEER